MGTSATRLSTTSGWSPVALTSIRRRLRLLVVRRPRWTSRPAGRCSVPPARVRTRARTRSGGCRRGGNHPDRLKRGNCRPPIQRRRPNTLVRRRPAVRGARLLCCGHDAVADVLPRYRLGLVSKAPSEDLPLDELAAASIRATARRRVKRNIKRTAPDSPRSGRSRQTIGWRIPRICGVLRHQVVLRRWPPPRS